MAAASRFRLRCRGRSGLRRATVLANSQSGRLEGKCHREQTADGPLRRAQARVKRCGKSAPGAGATRLARQTPPGARPSRGHGGPPPHQGQSPGRPRRWMAAYGPKGPGQNPAYRPTHRAVSSRIGSSRIGSSGIGASAPPRPGAAHLASIQAALGAEQAQPLPVAKAVAANCPRPDGQPDQL